MEDDDLAILVDLEYIEKESKLDEDFLPRDEQHWKIEVYGCHADQLDGTIDAEYSFDMSFELSDDTETTTSEDGLVSGRTVADSRRFTPRLDRF